MYIKLLTLMFIIAIGLTTLCQKQVSKIDYLVLWTVFLAWAAWDLRWDVF